MICRKRHYIIIPCLLVFLHFGQLTTLNAPMLAQTGPGSQPSLFKNGVSGLPGPAAEEVNPLTLAEIQTVKRMAIARYGSDIRRHARTYGMDWRLILAVMRQESQFREHAISYAGAYGLMQIIPGTAEMLARQLGLKDLSAPVHNILGGTHYLARLYDLFPSAAEADRICLALAAYNAGPGRVYDAQEVAAYLGENPNSWSTIQKMLPLLSQRNYSLHRSIWPEGKPRWGYFGDSRQTVTYVSKVIMNYTGLRLAFAAG